MNRRQFISSTALVVAGAIVGVPSLGTPPAVLVGQDVTEEVLHSLPVGSLVKGCRLEITRELPLGVHYWECNVTAADGFQGRAMLYAPVPADDHERYLQDNTSAIGCFFNTNGVEFPA